MIELREDAVLLAIAEYAAGVRENAPNDGPRVREYLARVGLPPGQPWCGAFAYWNVDEACKKRGVPNPLPRTGKVTTMWHKCPVELKTLVPVRGAIFLHIADEEADAAVDEPDRVYGPGHCGFVTDPVFAEHRNLTVEGNTNGKGSRNGDRVWCHSRPFDYVNVGYIDLGRYRP